MSDALEQLTNLSTRLDLLQRYGETQFSFFRSYELLLLNVTKEQQKNYARCLLAVFNADRNNILKNVTRFLLLWSYFWQIEEEWEARKSRKIIFLKLKMSIWWFLRDWKVVQLQNVPQNSNLRIQFSNVILARSVSCKLSFSNLMKTNKTFSENSSKLLPAKYHNLL